MKIYMALDMTPIIEVTGGDWTQGFSVQIWVDSFGQIVRFRV